MKVGFRVFSSHRTSSCSVDIPHLGEPSFFFVSRLNYTSLRERMSMKTIHTPQLHGAIHTMSAILR